VSQTTDNLEAAFAGESQASQKYLSFAKKADQEGYLQSCSAPRLPQRRFMLRTISML